MYFTFRLLWRDSRHSLVLRLELIVQVEDESGGIMGGSGKIVLHLAQPQRGMHPADIRSVRGFVYRKLTLHPNSLFSLQQVHSVLQKIDLE